MRIFSGKRNLLCFLLWACCPFFPLPLVVASQTLPIETIAGNGEAGKKDSTGTGARFNAPAGIQVSPDGNYIYIADFYNNSIRAIDSKDLSVTTLAGGNEGFADGPSEKAKFALPYDLCVSPDGRKIYVTDWYNCRIRKIDFADPGSGSGNVSTLAGSSKSGLRDGTGIEAQFFKPAGICISSDGKYLYVSDQFNNAIRKIDIESGEVSTLAGGTFGSRAGTGKDAQFKGPSGICMAPDGQSLFVADKGNNNIRKIELLSGSVSTLAGSKEGYFGFTDGAGADVRFSNPNGICITKDGKNLFVTDFQNQRIRKIEVATGKVWTIAGSGQAGLKNYTLLGSTFRYPNMLCMSPDETKLYITDRDNHCVRAIDIPGIRPMQIFPELAEKKGDIKKAPKGPVKVSVLAGDGVSGREDGEKSSAHFNAPAGIAASYYGRYLYVADFYNDAIRRIDVKTRIVTTIAGGVQGFSDGSGSDARFALPYGICASPDNKCLYVSDWYNCRIRTLEFDLEADTLENDVRVSTLAGSDKSGFRDGNSSEAHFFKPAGICITKDGNYLYVCDQFNNAIRKAETRTGNVTTVAGGAFGLQDGYGKVAQFKGPSGICISPDDKYLYVSDKGSNNIRRIDTGTGQVTTIAGSPLGYYGYKDGGKDSSRFSSPNGLAISSDGKFLYVTDVDNQRIRKIALDTKTITTFAGSGEAGFENRGFPDSEFRYPNMLCFSPNNYALYLTDRDNHCVRTLTLKAGQTYTVPPPPPKPKTEQIASSTPVLHPDKKTTKETTEKKNTVIKTASVKKPSYVSPNIRVFTLAGTGEKGYKDGKPDKAMFNSPSGVCLSPKGDYLYIADTYNHAVRRLHIKSKSVSTVAGGKEGFNDGNSKQAKFYYPYDVCFSPDGKKLYVSDAGNCRIRVMEFHEKGFPDKVITLCGDEEPGLKDGNKTNARFNQPAGICISKDGKTLYVADQKNNAIRIVETATGNVRTLTGSGTAGRTDGTGLEAEFRNPTDLCLSADNKILYVSDRGNYTIRSINLSDKKVGTVAGSPGVYSYAEGQVSDSRFNVPSGLCLTPDGNNLLIADSKNNRIRVLTLNEMQVGPVAGNGKEGIINGNAVKASFKYPAFLTISLKGTEVFVADRDNHVIRKLDIPLVAVQ